MAVGQFNGTLNAGGYTAPSPTTVTWTHPSSPTPKTKTLNPAVSTQSHFDLLGRYGENDPQLRDEGWQTIPAVSSEHGGGEIYGLVEELFKRNGLNRPPTEMEWVDFGFANFPSELFVSIDAARRVLPDYRMPNGSGGDEELVACRAEVSNLKQANANLQAQVVDLGQQVTRLKQEKKLVIPTAINGTLSEMLDWRDIPKPGGRLNRLKALVKWIRDEERRRQQ